MHQSIPSGPDVTEHIQTQTHTQVSDLGLMVGSLQSASLVSGIWYSEWFAYTGSGTTWTTWNSHVPDFDLLLYNNIAFVISFNPQN